MRIFNSFQLVAIFIGWPFLISWLHSATFSFSQVAFYGAAALYVVMVGFAVGMAHEFIGKD